MRVFKVVTTVVAAIFLLTACDPPMPPEVKAALAEQTYTCVEGDTKLSAPSAIALVSGDWQSSVEANCPGMTITPVEASDEGVELQVGATKKCVAFSRVPFAIDAAVLAVSLPDITNLNLSAEAISAIWSGKISNWNDPVLVDLNPAFELPNTAITFGSEITEAEAKPLSDWLTRLSGDAQTFVGPELSLDAMTDGGLVLTKYSAAVEFGATMVGIAAKAGEDGVIPELGSLNSGASMFKTETQDGLVTSIFNPKAKPIAPEGVDQAPAPYQAVAVIELNLCGTDSLKTRAAARYLLRQDSQGALGLSTVVSLPENLRLVSLDQVSKGLPEPEITEQPN